MFISTITLYIKVNGPCWVANYCRLCLSLNIRYRYRFRGREIMLSNVFLPIKYHSPHSRQKLFLYLLILTLKSNFMQMIYILMLI